MFGLTAESLFMAAFFYGLLGALVGVILGTLARPRWSALPPWIPGIARHAPAFHVAYGALVVIGGALLAQTLLWNGMRWPSGHDAWHALPALALGVAGAIASTATAGPGARAQMLAAHARTILYVAGTLLIVMTLLEALIDLMWDGGII